MSISQEILTSLSPYAACKLHVLRHDGHAFCVQGAEVGVFEQTNEISLWSLLKSSNRGRLKADTATDVLCNFPNEPLEWQLANQQLSWLLEATDLPKSDSAWAIAMMVLTKSPNSWHAFSSWLRGQNLPSLRHRSILASCLLSASHEFKIKLFWHQIQSYGWFTKMQKQKFKRMVMF